MRAYRSTTALFRMDLHRVAFRAPLEPREKELEVPTIFGPKPATAPRTGEAAEIVRVLSRAAEDPRFAAALLAEGSRALAAYELSLPAQAALVSGDLNWLEARVGTLTPWLRTWVDRRLQCEAW